MTGFSDHYSSQIFELATGAMFAAKDSRPLLESQAPDLTILDVSNIFRCPYWQDDLELGAVFAVR